MNLFVDKLRNFKMIKLQQKQCSEIFNQKIRICLSPFCFNAQNRLFQVDKQQNHPFYLHNKQQCSKWVTNIGQFSEGVTGYKPKQLSKIELDFNAEPIQTLRKIARLQKSDWKKHLTKQIAVIRKQINSALQLMQSNIEKKFESILSKKKYHTQISSLITQQVPKLSTSKQTKEKSTSNDFTVKNLMKEPQSVQLSQKINKYFFQNGQAISQMKSVHFLNKVQIKDEIAEIKNKIKRLENKIIEEKNVFNVRSTQRIDFYEWIFTKQDNMFNRLQFVGNLFSIKQQNYHVQEQNIRLNCMFCQKFVIQKVTASHLKQLKKFMADQLIIHMYNEHHDRIFYSYLKKVSKTQQLELKISQVMQKISKSQQFHIIDRETGVSYTEDFVSTQIQAIDVLTKKNIHLAKNNYVLIESKQALNSFVTILAYECWLNKKKALIVSTRFDHLGQVAAIFQMKNIETAKKYDGSLFVKFQDQKMKDIAIVKKSSSN